MSFDAVAVHFKRRHRKPLVASKRKGKVLRLEPAGRGVRLCPGEPERLAEVKAASLCPASISSSRPHSGSSTLRFGAVIARCAELKDVPGNGSGRPFAVGFGDAFQKRFIRLLCFGIVVELLHDAAIHLLQPFIFLNLVQDELADGAFVRQFIKKFELVGVGFNPRINFFIGAGIFTVLNRRV